MYLAQRKNYSEKDNCQIVRQVIGPIITLKQPSNNVLKDGLRTKVKLLP